MSNDLVKSENVVGELVVESKYGDDKTHDMIAGSTGFLPRLQLVAASANLVKKKLAEGGTYVIVQGKDKIIHALGDNVSMLVLGWRPKALRFGEKTVNYYNPNSPLFKQVETDSTQKDSGCMFGPEYLVYLPDHDVLATFHFNNPTMRQAASPMKQNLGGGVTCRVELIEKKHSWYAPVITACSTPPNLPTPGTPERAAWNERIKLQIEKFNTPKESEEELAEAVPEGSGEQRTL